MLQYQSMKVSFRAGDTIAVHTKIIEKERIAGKTKREMKEEQKERVQVFEGVVIAIKNREENTSFTVRKISVDNIGVERIWPLKSPWITKIIVKKRGSARRAKLYYLRKLSGKKAKKIESGQLVNETVGQEENTQSAQKEESKTQKEEKTATPETKKVPIENESVSQKVEPKELTASEQT
jgi:large subunit ribosomal protein L19